MASQEEKAAAHELAAQTEASSSKARGTQLASRPRCSDPPCDHD